MQGASQWLDSPSPAHTCVCSPFINSPQPPFWVCWLCPGTPTPSKPLSLSVPYKPSFCITAPCLHTARLPSPGRSLPHSEPFPTSTHCFCWAFSPLGPLFTLSAGTGLCTHQFACQSLCWGVGYPWRQDQDTPWGWHKAWHTASCWLKVMTEWQLFPSNANPVQQIISILSLLDGKISRHGASITEASVPAGRNGTHPDSPTQAGGHSTNARAPQEKSLICCIDKAGKDTVATPELACHWLIYSQNPSSKWRGHHYYWPNVSASVCPIPFILQFFWWIMAMLPEKFSTHLQPHRTGAGGARINLSWIVQHQGRSGWSFHPGSGEPPGQRH